MDISQQNFANKIKNPQSVVSLMSQAGKNAVNTVRNVDESEEKRGSIILLDDSPMKLPDGFQSHNSKSESDGSPMIKR